eukprot:TRINITY_DN18038_c0_g1_i4.p2 TRINITY_DN18038_c0_g1~~TRINITY_DN18038_c0_g1_i4.p2  ORF type:complete len:479 (+),score=100.98 TRINITY_DN18038_c0_g1_i4:76-1437(+)
MTARCRGRVTAAAALSGLLAAARWHTRGAQQQAATVGTPPPRATLQQARPEWCTAALRSGGPFALPAGTGGGPGNQKPGIAFAMKEAQRLRRALLVPLIAQAGMRMGGLDRLDQAPWCSAALRAGHCVRCSPLPPPWHSAGPALGLGALAGDPVMARGSEDDARVAAALLGLWERQRNCTAQLGGKGKRMSPSSRPLCPVVLLRGGPRQHRLAILPELASFAPSPRLRVDSLASTAPRSAVHLRIEEDWRAWQQGALFAEVEVVADAARGVLRRSAVFVAVQKSQWERAAAALRAVGARAVFRPEVAAAAGVAAGEWSHAQQAAADEHLCTVADRFVGSAHSTFSQGIFLARGLAQRPSWLYHAPRAASSGWWPLWRPAPPSAPAESCPQQLLRIDFVPLPCPGRTRNRKGQLVAPGCWDSFRVQRCGEAEAEYESRVASDRRRAGRQADVPV